MLVEFVIHFPGDFRKNEARFTRSFGEKRREKESARVLLLLLLLLRLLLRADE